MKAAIKFDWRTRDARRIVRCRALFLKSLSHDGFGGRRPSRLFLLDALGGLGSAW